MDCLQILGYCAAFRVCKLPQAYGESNNNKKIKLKYIYKIALYVIAYVVNSNVTEKISPFPCASNIMKILQNWGDYEDMYQGGIIYMIYAGDVFLICWFGTQLAKHVRENTV